MKKTLLAKVDFNSFDGKIVKNIKRSGHKHDVAYNIKARRHYIGQQHILAVDFYNVTKKMIEFRIFFSKTDFICQWHENHKWFTSTLEKLGFYSQTCVPCSTEDKQTIFDFFKRKAYIDNNSTVVSVMMNFQTRVRAASLLKKHKKIMVEIDSQFKCIRRLPKGIHNWIENTVLKNNQYIFYRKKGKRIDAYCSACCSEVRLTQAFRNKRGICPSCGKRITFKPEGYCKGIWDNFVFTYLQKGEDNQVIVRVFEGYKHYRNNFRLPELSFSEKRRYIINSKRTDYKAFHMGNFKQTGKYRWCNGLQSEYNMYWSSHSYTDVGYLYQNNLPYVLNSTEKKRTRIETIAKAMKFDVTSYLLSSHKDAVIHLIDKGLFQMASDSLTSWDYNGKEAYTLLKKHNQFIDLFREIQISFRELVYIDSYLSPKLIRQDILLFLRKVDLQDFKEILGYTTPVKAMNYINKQKTERYNEKDILKFWIDNIHMAKNAGYNPTKSFVLFVKDLYDQHDKYMKEIRAQAKEVKLQAVAAKEKLKAEQAKKMREEMAFRKKVMAKLYEKYDLIYTYENKKLIIRPAKSPEEIINEGTELHHCVGSSSYMDNMVNGENIILFIRKKEEPEKPYYTVEYRNGEIAQCRGFNNNRQIPVPIEVTRFTKNWLRYLKKKEQPQSVAA